MHRKNEPSDKARSVVTAQQRVQDRRKKNVRHPETFGSIEKHILVKLYYSTLIIFFLLFLFLTERNGHLGFLYYCAIHIFFEISWTSK